MRRFKKLRDICLGYHCNSFEASYIDNQLLIHAIEALSRLKRVDTIRISFKQSMADYKVLNELVQKISQVQTSTLTISLNNYKEYSFQAETLEFSYNPEVKSLLINLFQFNTENAYTDINSICKNLPYGNLEGLSINLISIPINLPL